MNVGIAVKRSAYDHYIQDGPLEEQFDADDREAILEGHQEHYDTLENVVDALEDAGHTYDIAYVPDSPDDAFGDHEYVVSVGGDGTVLETARYLEDTPLAPLRSTGTSTGALCRFHRDAYEEVVEDLEDPEVEDWTRIDADVDGEEFTALNELYVGAYPSQKVTDLDYEIGDEEGTHRGSGMVIATPAGRSGWHDNILQSQHMDEDLEIDDPSHTVEELYYIGREPLEPHWAAEGVIGRDDTMEISSGMNDNVEGIVSPDGSDGERMREFSRGSTLRVSVSDSPLRVVTGSGE